MHSESTPIERHLGMVSKTSFSLYQAEAKAPPLTLHYHYHDCYELYYLYSGERYYFIKDKSYLIKHGDLVLINAYDIHATTNSEGHGYHRLVINFKKHFLKDYLHALGELDLFECFEKDVNIVRFEGAQREALENMLELIQQEYHEPKAGQQIYLQTALLQLLLTVKRSQPKQDVEKVNYINSTHKIISDITGFINNHYNEDISLESISQQFFISPYYLSRTFKKITGFSFVAYLNSIRIKESQKLLSQTDLNVCIVAELVGYKSTTHFGRTFKESTGITPLEYRKAVRDTK